MGQSGLPGTAGGRKDRSHLSTEKTRRLRSPSHSLESEAKTGVRASAPCAGLSPTPTPSSCCGEKLISLVGEPGSFLPQVLQG